jgi:hypothetical protein
MGWLAFGFGAYLGFCPLYLAQSVTVIGLQTFLLSGHALVACSHELASILLPGVEGRLLFLLR